jgi:hypothetical protein
MAQQIPPNVMEMMLDMLEQIEDSEEFFETIASIMKKLYDALLKAGFTEKQAVRIVAGFAAKGNS